MRIDPGELNKKIEILKGYSKSKDGTQWRR